ncbi:conserved hypothetical protein [Vibrio chagasii]|nr:conserved hypothetical protein [Vibrio chagasii]CAH6910570.1 conserved hypothetical protein [Vibrio chagasii]CAH6935296.1 conserved hypothetical protein [Vibrio chagasii]CAH6976778.1 conserved hypothetical protein [Vibrio chagasii]CAH6994198.1 conserved hypothetical protein [Vibrio chagasii]
MATLVGCPTSVLASDFFACSFFLTRFGLDVLPIEEGGKLLIDTMTKYLPSQI